VCSSSSFPIIDTLHRSILLHPTFSPSESGVFPIREAVFGEASFLGAALAHPFLSNVLVWGFADGFAGFWLSRLSDARR